MGWWTRFWNRLQSRNHRSLLEKKANKKKEVKQQ
jgi:hypothetical protein